MGCFFTVVGEMLVQVPSDISQHVISKQISFYAAVLVNFGSVSAWFFSMMLITLDRLANVLL